MAAMTIYTTSFCPYCTAAKRLLDSLGIDFEEIGLDDKPELRHRLSENNGGWRTVPMIFAGDRFLGGYTDVRELHGRGELAELVGR